ncbi:DUF3368 domain-containing protein [soil metagenome]
MPKLVCNTSPLQYLHQLELLFILPELAEVILVPEAVVSELEAGRAVGVDVPKVRELEWLTVERPKSLSVLPLVTDLGKGEVEVLALALEQPGCISVLDDKLARNFAQILNLPFTGTLGLLLDAKQRRLIENVSPAIGKLQALGFRVHPSTVQMMLRLAGEAE